MAYETVTLASGLVLAVDNIAALSGSIEVTKIDVGADGAVSGPVCDANPMPIKVMGTPNVAIPETVNVAVTTADLGVHATAPIPTTPATHVKGYHAGVSGNVDVPTGKLIRTVSAIAGPSGGSIVVLGGDTIVLPANSAFEDDVNQLAVSGTDIVFAGTITYYVSWEV